MPIESEIAAGSPCEYLEWDSNFFECRIGKVRDGSLSAGRIGEILEWCGGQRIDCLYLLAASNDAHAIAVCEKHGFHLVDIRVTFERSLEQIPADGHGSVRQAQPSDIEVLRRIARSSFYDSRFYCDPGFEKSRCDDLYAFWIETSCRGYADIVLVVEVDGQPAGFVTCHVGPGSTGSIGLITVDEAYQGRGLGRQLVTSALRALSEREMRSATVVTQGRNISSQRLYQKCGFISRSVELWYHRWFEWPASNK